MPRGLEHIVHAVRDLDAAGDDYARLGFTVGARNHHPWGTDNRIVQLPGFFIELLSVVDLSRVPEPTDRLPSFGAFNRDFLTSGEGFSMLALESQDAAVDAAAFRAAGIGDFDVFRFAREARRADGTPVQVAFSLAFAADPQPTRAGFFTCRQHYPENFWSPALQNHANGACAVKGVVMVADNPTDHHIFLSAYVGERDLEATSSGVTVRTPRGEIQVMDPAAYRIHFGIEPPSIAAGARLAALRLGVRDVPATAAAVAVATERMGRLVVAPPQAHGAALVFESADG